MSTYVDVVTRFPIEAVNVTEMCARLVAGSATGIAMFYVPHTTAALIISEDDEELRDDLVRVARELLAPLRPFRHRKNDNPNAEAHVLSSLAGTSITVPVTDGVLELGTYQTIMLLEFDGPKSREVRCRVIAAS
jgi:secondary thiamine-phosphate synthase enzyme